MMDQLYANQTTAGKPANGIVVNSLSQIGSSNIPPKHSASFKGQLENTQTANLNTPTSLPNTNNTEAIPENEQEFGFLDFLDIINPLQHIPVVSSIYREITGDELKPAARVFGGMLFGGPSGFVSAIANSIVEETTSKDIGANIFEALLGPDEALDSVQVAKISSPTNQIAASSPKNVADNPDLSNIFAPLSPTTVPAPTFLQTTSAATTHPLHNPPLEGKAALAAIYNDLGTVKTKTNQDVTTKALQVAEALPPTTIPLNHGIGKPGKWFPLNGNNVIMAQTSAPPSVSTIPDAPAEPSKPIQELASSDQSDFAQNLLTGLEKYQELKKP
ncbi:hypothetical protein [Kiloniella antarctica]|uniref:Uncharacterized protein n=1 Tax=Kiloniella antarctica TaxID=1550907 RepID=A0ABW5BJF5_9PROT